MKHIGQKIISLLLGGLAFYATSIPITPIAIWMKITVFVVVSLIVYVLIKPKKS